MRVVPSTPIIEETEGFEMSTFRTWQPKVRRRKRVHGFRARMQTKGGRKVIQARRKHGRHKLTVQTVHVKKVTWNAS